MYNFEELKKEILILNNKAVLGEPILPHTAAKIQVIAKYVDNWLYVVENTDRKDIYFIDIMSNAGLYGNGYLGTYVEVLNCFLKHASLHVDKHYHLICNDNDESKYNTILLVKKVFEKEFRSDNLSNISIECLNYDATYALNVLSNRFSGNFDGFILLFVDPYNMINVALSKALIEFCNKVYCELILNYFFSDYLRNFKNEQAKTKKREIGEFASEICKMNSQEQSPDEVMHQFFKVLIEHTKFKFKYTFLMKNTNNVPLYYLVFFTPHRNGLKKLKKQHLTHFDTKGNIVQVKMRQIL